MSQKEGSKEISYKNEIKTNQYTIEETRVSLEEDEVKIDIDNDNEIKVTEYTDNQESADEVNLDISNTENSVFVLAYGNPRTDGQLFGTGQQNVYRGASDNLYQQPPPYPTQKQLQYQEHAPPAEEPAHREMEATSDYIPYNPETRNRFIKCIMSIVLIMLLITAAFIAVVLAVPDVKYAFDQNRTVILIPTIILILFVNYAMTCLSPCTRHRPCNIIFLFLSVIGMSLLSGVLTSYFDTQIVLYAFVSTTAVVFMCILLACTSFDFTSYLLYVIVIVTTFGALFLVLMSALFMAQVELKPTFLGFLVLSTLLQVIIFTIHLQTIIGGKRVELREQDYALGAYMLYMSVIDIFMKMVLMFGISSDM